MRWLIFGGVAAAAVGIGIYFQDGEVGANLYASKPDEIKQILMSTSIPDAKLAPFGKLDVEKSDPAPNQVQWVGKGSHAYIVCLANIEATGENQSRVSINCNGGSPSNGVANQTSNEMTEVAMREFVDSTLTGRPFNSDIVQAGAVATVAKNLPKMQKDAIKAARDVSEIQREADQAEDDSGDDFPAEKFGEPVAGY